MGKLHIFQNAGDYQAFSAGQVIFRQGSPGDVMYVVQEGEVDIMLADHVLETVEAGGLLGELALIDNRPRTATAVASTDCKVVAIDQERFTFLVQETPFFALRVMQAMAERIRYMDALALQKYAPFDQIMG